MTVDVSKQSNSPATWQEAFCASALWTAQLLGQVCFRHCRQPTRAAAACTRRQVRDGLLASNVVDAIPIPSVRNPLYFGSPRNVPCRKLATAAERRWRVGSVPTRVYWPTSQFARLYGSWTGQDELKRPELAGHDLLLSAVWLIYLQRHPSVALQHWKSERRLQWEHRRGGRLESIPDALVTAKGRATAIEVLGQYPAEWIEHHCRGFAAENWNVAIW